MKVGAKSYENVKGEKQNGGKVSITSMFFLSAVREPIASFDFCGGNMLTHLMGCRHYKSWT